MLLPYNTMSMDAAVAIEIYRSFLYYFSTITDTTLYVPYVFDVAAIAHA